MQGIALHPQARAWLAFTSHPQQAHRLALSPRLSMRPRLVTRPQRIGSMIVARSMPPGQPPKKPSSGWRSFWATVDAGAWLGAVGTAIAFLLTQEAMLVGGPIVLPLIALYASKQRGRLDSEAAQAELQAQVAAALRQVSLLSEESAAEVAEEVAALVDEVRQGRSSPEKAVRSVEAKLNAMEGSVRSVSEATKEALSEAASQRGKAVKELSNALVVLRRDINADLRQATGDELAALGRLDSRLAALEGAVAGLEVAQSEGLRRLSSSMSGALSEEREVLAAAVRDEVWQSLEAVRQLPQALAAAAPGLAERNGMPQLSEDTLRSLVAQEVAAAGQELLEQQRSMLQEAMAAPATIAPVQWNQLGKRLVAVDTQLAALIEGQEEQLKSLEEGDGASAAEQVAALRTELQALSMSLIAAIEQQAASQQAAVAMAAASAQPVAAEQMLLAPLEAALLELQNELRTAAEVAAIDMSAKEAKWVVDLEIKLIKLINPVIEAIAAARATAITAATISTSAAVGEGVDASAAAQAAVFAEQQAALEQAAAGIAAISEKIEGLGSQLSSLEERLVAENAANREAAAASTSSAPSPGLGNTPGADNEIAVQVEQTLREPSSQAIDSEEASRASAYERMQALLHDGREESTNQDADEDRQQQQQQQSTTTAAAGATGVPIKAWLSGDVKDEEDDVRSSEVPQQAEILGSSPAGGKNLNTGASPSLRNSAAAPGPARRNVLQDEQIAMEAGLAALEDYPSEEESGNKEESATSSYEAFPAEKETTPGTSSTATSSPAAETTQIEEPSSQKSQSQATSAVTPSPATLGTEEIDAVPESQAPAEQNESAGQQGEWQAPADLDALYSEGLELLREGRSLASVDSSNPQAWDALDAADVALGDATKCFQAVATGAEGTAVIKALGNGGNALMARARVKRQLAQITAEMSAIDGGKSNNNEEVEILLSEAKDLLVVAGRRYREVLQRDPSQGRAFLNWGRAVCLRAEMAREVGDLQGARSLFCNAAEKFQAALQLDADPTEGMQLAGSALASAAACLEAGSGGGNDVAAEEEERLGLLEEAEEYLAAAVEAGAGEEAERKMWECRRLLGYTR